MNHYKGMTTTINEDLQRIVSEQYQWLSPAEQTDLVAKTLKRLTYRIARGFRTCVTCQKKLQPVHFPQDRSSRDGLASRCKPCDRARYKERKGIAEAAQT